MSETHTVYIERHPGDLITAEDWNDIQRKIRSDIQATSAEAAEGVDHVTTADDASHLDGKNVEELTDEITKRVLESVQAESGYRQMFRILDEGEVDVIEHNLGSCPLVDVYKLQYFEVVCREDDDTYPSIATFYLHHSGEKRIRVTDENGNRRTIDIQPDNLPAIGIPFADMLARYDVEYSDTTSLEDLEVEFWKAFFSEPNDEFDDNQYCHSPWFERCCKEQRDVAGLKSKGDWDDIWFQARPWKIVGGPATTWDSDTAPFKFADAPVPANVAVGHLDFNRVALWLQGEAIHSGDAEDALPDEFRNQLKVMVLLRA
jgi:hypothetical protein